MTNDEYTYSTPQDSIHGPMVINDNDNMMIHNTSTTTATTTTTADMDDIPHHNTSSWKDFEAAMTASPTSGEDTYDTDQDDDDDDDDNEEDELDDDDDDDDDDGDNPHASGVGTNGCLSLV